MILEETAILKISEDLSDKDDLEKLSFAADIIKRGGTVCFPTETVYGLGANALNESAVSSIFEAKGRPQDNPLIIHLDSIDKADSFCFAKENPHLSQVKKFMPGPITVVLKKRDIVPNVVTAGLDTVGVRVPENKVANKFIELCGVPVAAPSANISGKPSPTCPEHVIEDLSGRVDVILCAGCARVGLESTIIKLVGEERPTLLRPGAVTLENLTECLGDIELSPAILSEMKPGDVASAPGMKYRHYAPNAPVFLVMGDEEDVRNFISHRQKTENCAVLVFSEDKDYVDDTNLFDIGSKHDTAMQAHMIFAALRATDAIPSLSAVYVHITGDKSGLNLALFNRLLKASAYNIISLKEELK